MCKSNEDIDLWSGNVQIQPWKFEPLKSGLHLVKINLSGSDITRWRTISTSGSTRLPINNERIDHMDWWAFLNMLKTTLQRLVIKLMNTGYLRVFALFYFVFIEMMCTFPYCQYEKPIRWVVLWEFLALKPILLMLFYMPCRCCFRPYNFEGFGVFKG